MIKSIFARLAIDTEMKKDPFLHRRILMTAALLVGTTVTFAVFVVINFDPKNYILPLVNFLISLSSGLALYSLIVKKSFYFSAYYSTTLLFTFLIFFSYFAKNESFALVWTLCYPLFVIPILGTRKGLTLIVVFYAAIIPMAYLGIGEWDYGFWDLKGFVRFTIASLVIVYATCFFEISASSAYETIQKIRDKEKIHLQELENLSVTDQLTGLRNRRYFDDNFVIERKKIKRYNNNLCLIMIDIDHFKHINDEFGHQVGDVVLKEFSILLLSIIRETDLLSRWGGEEFIILLPETSLENSINVAEKMLAAINQHSFTTIGKLTASFGVAKVATDSKSNSESLNQVDQALYQAKNQGRNRVVAYESET